MAELQQFNQLRHHPPDRLSPGASSSLVCLGRTAIRGAVDRYVASALQCCRRAIAATGEAIDMLRGLEPGSATIGCLKKLLTSLNVRSCYASANLLDGQEGIQNSMSLPLLMCVFCNSIVFNIRACLQRSMSQSLLAKDCFVKDCVPWTRLELCCQKVLAPLCGPVGRCFVCLRNPAGHSRFKNAS